MFAVTVGNMAALIGKLDVRAADFKEKMDDLDDFMTQVPPHSPYASRYCTAAPRSLFALLVRASLRLRLGVR